MIQGSVIRLTNCFGPPETLKNDCWNLSINQFVLSAICNQNILIKNNPYNRRDFISLSEFARLFFSNNIYEKYKSQRNFNCIIRS